LLLAVAALHVLGSGLHILGSRIGPRLGFVTAGSRLAFLLERVLGFLLDVRVLGVLGDVLELLDGIVLLLAVTALHVLGGGLHVLGSRIGSRLGFVTGRLPFLLERVLGFLFDLRV